MCIHQQRTIVIGRVATMAFALLLGFQTCSTVKADLVAWWNLDDGSGSTALDTSPSPVGSGANSGALMGAGLSSNWNANLTGASDGLTMPHGLYFDGGANNQFVDLTPHVADFNGMGHGSLSLWFRRDIGSTLDMTMVGSSTSDNNEYTRLMTDSMNDGLFLRATERTSANNDNLDAPIQDDGNWHHTVFTSDGINCQVFLDGELVQTGTQGFFDISSLDMALGYVNRGLTTPSWHFLGTLGDVRIYDEVLALEQVDYLSNPENYGNGLDTPPLSMEIDRTSGNIRLVNSSSSPQTILSYSIVSDQGTLDRGSWTSIADTYDADSHNGSNTVDADDEWLELGNGVDSNGQPNTDLSEFEPGTSWPGNAGNGATIGGQSSIDLGNAWIASPFEDATAEVLLPNGEIQTLAVNYVPGTGEFSQFPLGDLDLNGVVNLDDFINEFVPAYGLSTSGLSNAQQYLEGDLNGDGVVGGLDFLQFKEYFSIANPGAAALTFPSAQVPEPQSLSLLCLVGLGWYSMRLRNLNSAGKSVLVASMVLGMFFVCPSAQAIRITNTTSGNVLFYDGFETAPGVSNADYPDTSGDFDPDNGSAPGSWVIDEPTGINEVQVTNFVDSRPLGAFTGDNYGRFGRDDANFHPLAVMQNAAVTGDHIVVEAMFAGGPGYDTSSAGFSLVTGTDPNAPGDNVIAVSFTPGGSIRNRTPFLTGSERFEGVEGLSWTPDEWNYMKIEYTVGETAYDLTINEDTVQGIVIAFPNGVNDAVPGIPTIASSMKVAGHSSPAGIGSRLLADAVPMNDLRLEVNQTTGVISLINDSGIPVDIDFYRVSSQTNDALVMNALSGLADNNFGGSGLWTELGSSTTEIAEGALEGSSEISGTSGVPTSIALGNVYNTSTLATDLVFEVHVAGTDTALLLDTDNISYVTSAGLPGDFNNDGMVDAADYVVWRNNLGGDESLLNGNGDSSGTVDTGDYATWKGNFGASSGASSLQNRPIQVPEPSTLAVLVVIGIVVLKVSGMQKTR